MLIKSLIVILFVAILGSLAASLYFMVRGGDDKSKRMANALTVRISLSVALFLLLIFAWSQGLIQPHGVMPN